jgi:membrane protease YdiL (CAAX protease family)
MSLVCFAPIIEEVVFRGYLLNLWLERHRRWVAIFGASAAFGSWHFFTAPFAAGMGFILSLVFVKYRSLVLCIALHAIYNALVLRPVLGQFFMFKDKTTVTHLSSWLVELTLAIAFIPLAFLFWKRFRPQSTFSS